MLAGGEPLKDNVTSPQEFADFVGADGAAGLGYTVITALVAGLQQPVVLLRDRR
jgi:hypothetical protein